MSVCLSDTGITIIITIVTITVIVTITTIISIIITTIIIIITITLKDAYKILSGEDIPSFEDHRPVRKFQVEGLKSNTKHIRMC